MSQPLATPPAAPVHVAPAPKRRRRWPWIVGGTFGVLIVIGIASPSEPRVALNGDAAIAFHAANDAIADVTITQCASASGPLGMAQVTAKVHNSTDTVQSYMITVSLNDPAGNRLGEANGAVNSLAPGQSAVVDLIGDSSAGSTTCAVASVSRISV